MFLLSDAKAYEGTFSVKMFPYSGSSEIYSYEKNDTLIVEFDTKVAFNTVKAKNSAKILLSPLKVLSIDSEYSKLGVKSNGYLLFKDSLIETYSSDAKVKTKTYKAANDPNDWLVLPFFLMFYEGEIYSCSMIHGDFELSKAEEGKIKEWASENKNLIVRFEEDLFTYLKAGKIEMKRIK